MSLAYHLVILVDRNFFDGPGVILAHITSPLPSNAGPSGLEATTVVGDGPPPVPYRYRYPIQGNLVRSSVCQVNRQHPSGSIRTHMAGRTPRASHTLRLLGY